MTGKWSICTTNVMVSCIIRKKQVRKFRKMLRTAGLSEWWISASSVVQVRLPVLWIATKMHDVVAAFALDFSMERTASTNKIFWT